MEYNDPKNPRTVYVRNAGTVARWEIVANEPGVILLSKANGPTTISVAGPERIEVAAQVMELLNGR